VNPAGHDRFVEIGEAAEVLTDDGKRREWEAARHEHEQSRFGWHHRQQQQGGGGGWRSGGAYQQWGGGGGGGGDGWWETVMTADGRVWRVWRQGHRGGQQQQQQHPDQGASLWEDLLYGATVGLSSPVGMLTVVMLLTLLINLAQAGGQAPDNGRERRNGPQARAAEGGEGGAPAAGRQREGGGPPAQGGAHDDSDEPPRVLAESLRRRQAAAAAREKAAAARAAEAAVLREPGTSSTRGPTWDPERPPSDRTIAGGRDELFRLVSSFAGGAGSDSAAGSADAVGPTLLMADRQTAAWALGIQAFSPQWLFVVVLPTPAVGGSATGQRDADLNLSPAARRALGDVHAAWPQLAAAAGVGSAELAAFPILWVCAEETAVAVHPNGSGAVVSVSLGRKAPVISYHRQWARVVARRLERAASAAAAEAGEPAEVDGDDGSGVSSAPAAPAASTGGGFACVRVQPDIGSAAIAVLPFAALDDVTPSGLTGAKEVERRGGALAGWLLSVQTGNVTLRDASDAVMALVG
jgi:hypothetical protein